MTKRNGRLLVRLAPQEKLLLEQAASLEGQTLELFVRSSLLEKARMTFLESGLISLSRRDMSRFTQIMAANQGPSIRLKAAVHRYRKGRG
jgi:uncharacterized protein (DUF1778 family)